MSGEDGPEPECSSPEEALLRHFYAWEMGGRGWQVHDRPVRPEPAFQPFHGHFFVAPPPSDDARRHTILSSLTQKAVSFVLGSPREIAPVLVPPVQSRPKDDPPRDFVELAVQLAPDATPEIENFEQLLVGLGGCRKPLAFELIGNGKKVILQFVVDEEDAPLVEGQLEAYFPEAVVSRGNGTLFWAWEEAHTDSSLVVEFGLSHEFMLPLATCQDLASDPFVAIVAVLAAVRRGEIGVVQVLFESVRHSWSQSVIRAVTRPDGSAFFDDAPEFLAQAKKKIARPLFAATLRIAAASFDEARMWQVTRNLTGALRQFSNPAGNELIPLSNDEYDDVTHVEDLLARRCRRSGMLLNSEELASFVHLPSEEVQSPKLERLKGRTKAASSAVTGHQLLLGTNVHNGRDTKVSMSTEQRVRHMHVIGASGTGKSTFLLNLILQDIVQGQGIGVIDPHGDLIDHIIARIPPSRIKDVVLVDPSDEAFPIGFNILSAHSDLEKTLLASDLVAVFRRYSTTWGDQMGSVLSNAVLAFLESTRGGTLADLRRFLIEPVFRNEFLSTVTDSHVLYFWKKEFPVLVGRPQAPLLTRLDTFLRPKPVRYMVSQKVNRLDFADIMDSGKIFLAKLAQGAIGEENASLLGSLLVSKFHQLTLGRQSQSESSRRLFALYCDEFGGYVTPSMGKLLSGARKFRLALVLSHQELQQINDPDVLSAIIGNAGTRICFRVGEKDAKTLADGFASFEQSELCNLSVGEAICRVGRSDDDFNLQTDMMKGIQTEQAAETRKAIIEHTRATYATKRELVEAEIARDRGEIEAPVPAKPVDPKKETGVAAESVPSEPEIENVEVVNNAEVVLEPQPVQAPVIKPRKQKAMPPMVAEMGKGGRRHKYLQHFIAQMGQGLGYRASIEMPTGSGAESVDVVLERESRRIAFEISVSSTVELELGNLKKCLAAGFTEIVMLCEETKTLNGLKREAERVVGGQDVLKNVKFMAADAPMPVDELLAMLGTMEVATVAGYKVKVSRKGVAGMDAEARKLAISKVMGKGMA